MNYASGIGSSFTAKITIAMKYKSCDKCGEIVTKTGFISSLQGARESGQFAKCNNQECAKYFSMSQYERLVDKEY